MIARLERKVFSRGFATIALKKFGRAADVLEISASSAVSAPTIGEVSVKIAANQVSTEDHRSINGLSLIRRSLGVAGSTGVGSVTSTGPGVKGISTNDKVLVASSGVWADNVTVAASKVIKIPSKLSVEEAAALPAALSAYAILFNYVGLKAGDVVLQFGGDSAVGAAISQIGTASGYKVVNVTQAQIDDANFSKTATAMGSVKLTITNTSKKSVSKNFLRSLAPGGCLVMYQGNGLVDEDDGVDVPVGGAIFKANSIFGFSFESWMASAPQEVETAMAAIAPHLESKKISLKSKVFPQADYLKALSATETKGEAVVLKM